ncbi:MAG: diaminopimelate epimerase [Muribaculaceae bacterium]|nr:diaminopimelate epimerase [Muribaculaceae bacterium]
MSEKRRLYFTKMHGIGNDYVYVDALGSPTSLSDKDIDFPDLSRKISNRHFGVGSDGLIAILPSSSADFRMRMFNADGSEAQMCGNGSRCVAKYLYDKGYTDKTSISLETKAGIKVLHLHIGEDGEVSEVTVDMGVAVFEASEVPFSHKGTERMISCPVDVDGEVFHVTAVGMGNPHGVVFVDRINDRHVHHYGRILETHAIWPERANIEFAEITDRRHIKMRVWERGSGETLACGTGACATLVAAYVNGEADNEAELELLGGSLHINYCPESGHVYMRGGAEFIAEGWYYYD